MSFDDQKIEIDVLQGTLDAETQFTYSSGSNLAHDTGTLAYAGISFQLTAQETVSGDPVTTFDPPLQVTIHYDPAALGDVPADSLRLYSWDTDRASWRDVVTTCIGGEYDGNVDQNWFRVTLCHLSEFAVLGFRPIEKAGFNIFLPLIRN